MVYCILLYFILFAITWTVLLSLWNHLVYAKKLIKLDYFGSVLLYWLSTLWLFSVLATLLWRLQTLYVQAIDCFFIIVFFTQVVWLFLFFKILGLIFKNKKTFLKFSLVFRYLLLLFVGFDITHLTVDVSANSLKPNFPLELNTVEAHGKPFMATPIEKKGNAMLALTSDGSRMLYIVNELFHLQAYSSELEGSKDLTLNALKAKIETSNSYNNVDISTFDNEFDSKFSLEKSKVLHKFCKTCLDIEKRQGDALFTKTGIGPDGIDQVIRNLPSHRVEVETSFKEEMSRMGAYCIRKPVHYHFINPQWKPFQTVYWDDMDVFVKGVVNNIDSTAPNVRWSHQPPPLIRILSTPHVVVAANTMTGSVSESAVAIKMDVSPFLFNVHYHPEAKFPLFKELFDNNTLFGEALKNSRSSNLSYNYFGGHVMLDYIELQRAYHGEILPEIKKCHDSLTASLSDNADPSNS